MSLHLSSQRRQRAQSGPVEPVAALQSDNPFAWRRNLRMDPAGLERMVAGFESDVLIAVVLNPGTSQEFTAACRDEAGRRGLLQVDGSPQATISKSETRKAGLGLVDIPNLQGTRGAGMCECCGRHLPSRGAGPFRLHTVATDSRYRHRPLCEPCWHKISGVE